MNRCVDKWGGGLSISGAVDKTVDNFRDDVDKGGLINI